MAYKKPACRECGKLINIEPWVNVIGGTGMLSGGNRVHISCFLSQTNPQEPLSTLPQAVTRYVESSRDPMKMLRAKVKDLEERLARANSTIANLQPSHRGTTHD